MEAKLILEKIRKRGFNITLMDNAISLAPKKLLNNRMIGFIREHKEALLTALYQEEDEYKLLHMERKRSLREGRLEVLRLILQRYLNPGVMGCKLSTDDKIESYLDWVLRQHDYDLEQAIDHYRSITPEPAIILVRCATCNYRPLFCMCQPKK